MVTAAEIRKVTRPLMARHSELMLKRRTAYVNPVDHLAKVIIFDRYQTGRGEFRVFWAIVPMFLPMSSLGFKYGGLLMEPQRRSVHTPGVEDRLIAQLEAIVFPVFDRVHTIEQFKAFAETGLTVFSDPPNPLLGLGPRDPLKMLVDAALGDFDAVDEALVRFRRVGRVLSPKEQDYIDTLGPPIDARDRAGVARVLHEWEAYTVRNQKVEDLWKPSPFPVEIDG